MADLNSLIAQGAQFQAPQDPFAQYGKMQQLESNRQEMQLRQQEMQDKAAERQRLVAERERRTTFLSGLGAALQKGGQVLSRDTLSQMIQSGIPEVEKLGFEGIKSLDEEDKFQNEMGKFKPAQTPVAPAVSGALGSGTFGMASAPTNALATPAQTTAPTNAMVGGYDRNQIESMLTSPNARVREMGSKLLTAVPKPNYQTAAPGSTVLQDGRVIYTAPEKAAAAPSMVAEYTFAKTPDGGNFKGSYQDFVTARAAAGRAPAQPRPEQPPVAVVDPTTGKQVFVTREEALRGRMTPAAAMESLPPKEIQKREAALPQATSAVQGFESKSDKFVADLMALRNHPGLSSITGIAAGRMPGLTADGRAAQALYDKVVAKGGFQALQDLRDASKTGGALGNVSNQEGKQLTASFASIDRRQDAPDVQAAIDQAIADIEGSKTRMREAYDSTYSYKSGGAAAPTPAPGKPAATLAPADKQALDWANANPKDPRSLQIKQRLGQ
jgi:hypothetical protein